MNSRLDTEEPPKTLGAAGSALWRTRLPARDVALADRLLLARAPLHVSRHDRRPERRHRSPKVSTSTSPSSTATATVSTERVPHPGLELPEIVPRASTTIRPAISSGRRRGDLGARRPNPNCSTDQTTRGRTRYEKHLQRRGALHDRRLFGREDPDRPGAIPPRSDQRLSLGG